MQASTTLLKKSLYLWLVRGIWICLALTAVLVVIASVGRDYKYFRTPCTEHKIEEQAACFEKAQNVAQLGLTFSFYSIFYPLRTLVEVLPWFIAGILIFWKKSDNVFGLLFSLMLVLVVPLNINQTIAGAALDYYPNLLPIFYIGNYIGAMLLILWYRFPDGQFIPRWLRWFAGIWIMVQSGNYFFRETAFNLYNLPSPWAYLIDPIFGISVIYAMVYRYRHTTDQAQKQQLKWVMFSGSILAVINSIDYLISVLIIMGMPWDTIASYIYTLIYQSLLSLSSLFVAVSLGFSILRYRLWDLNIFISQTIVYGGLTGILGVVGFAFVPLADYALTQALGNQSGALAVLAAALPIAALYNPIHERMQKWVDRRFKQEGIDFDNTFIEFSYELRGLFTVKELSALLARHAVEQLDVAYASVFLNGQNGQLKHITTVHSDQDKSRPSLDETTMEKMRKSQLASPDGSNAQSLVVPLVVPRSRKPSLVGALYLGPRVQGVGYSTSLLNSLKMFGEEVGKMFYAAKIQSDKAQALMEKE